MPRKKAGIQTPAQPTEETGSNDGGSETPRPSDDTGGTLGGGNPLGSRMRFTLTEGMRFLADLNAVAVNPRNLREDWEFETEEFQDFENNLKVVGEVQDPAVAHVSTYLNKYPELASHFGEQHDFVLIAGERRFRAARNRGAKELPVVLKDSLIEQGDFALLSENNWRKNFDPIQEGVIYKRMVDEQQLTYAQILEKLGGAAGERKISDISKRVRLATSLEGNVRRAVRTGQLKIEPAYLLLSKLKEPDRVNEGFEIMLKEKISAKEVTDRLAPPTKKAIQTSEADSAGDLDKGDDSERPSHGDHDAQGKNDPPGEGLDDAKDLGASSSVEKRAPVPAQKRTGGSENSGGKRTPPADLSDGPSGTEHRNDACRKLLATHEDLPSHARALRFAMHIVEEAPDPDLHRAVVLVGLEAATSELREQLMETGEEEALHRVAEALVILADDRCLDNCLADSTLTSRAARYLSLLEAGGYKPTPIEASAATGAVS